MRTTEREHLSNSFVLRIWWEEGERPIWRGWIQHAATSQSHYFSRLTDLLAFVEMHTGSLAHAPIAEANASEPREEA